MAITVEVNISISIKITGTLKNKPILAHSKSNIPYSLFYLNTYDSLSKKNVQYKTVAFAKPLLDIIINHNKNDDVIIKGTFSSYHANASCAGTIILSDIALKEHDYKFIATQHIQNIADDKWQKTNQLLFKTNPDLYTAWFMKVSLIQCTDNVIYLKASTHFIRDQIDSLYARHIERAWHSVTGKEIFVRVS